MAKERSDKVDKKEEKKDKKDKKEKKRSETDGVHKSSKKDKKEKRAPVAAEDADGDVTMQLESALNGSTALKPIKVEPDAVDKRLPVPVGALVPFANPLADEKVQKKLLKSVKKAAKNKSLKRGVKEVVKSLRKSAPSTALSAPPGIVILAADISPMDVISHIPVLCEDHSVPYIFVTSRAELGAAGSTKRPTSVVMVSPERGGKRKAGEKDEGEEEFKAVYADLLKVVEKESRNVRV